MFSCKDCGTSFGREDNLRRHKNHHCIGGERGKTCEPIQERIRKTYQTTYLDNEIPTFDRAKFCGDKALTRQTLNKMLKMLRVPENKWNKIDDEELLE